MHSASDDHYWLYTGLRGSRQGAGGVQRTPTGDNIVQADRAQRASIRVGLARIILGLGSPRKPGTQSTAWRGSMGEYKRFALLVFVIIGALLIVGASGGHAVQAETKEVVAAVAARDFYPEYVVDADGRPGGFSIDLMAAV